MMLGVQYCNVTSSWKSTHGLGIDPCVIYRVGEDGEADDSSSLNFSPEGLFLESPDEGMTPCTLHMRCRNPPYNVMISALDIISSVRHIELSDSQQGHIATSTGIQVNEVLASEQSLFLLQYTFDAACAECFIKLVPPVGDNSVYLHSCHVSIVIAESQPQSTAAVIPGISPTIDLDKVKMMLSDGGHELPKGAESLMAAVEQFQKHQRARVGSFLPAAQSDNQKTPQPSSLMAMLSSLDSSGTPSMDKSEPPQLGQLMSMFSAMRTSGPSSDPVRPQAPIPRSLREFNRAENEQAASASHGHRMAAQAHRDVDGDDINNRTAECKLSQGKEADSRADTLSGIVARTIHTQLAEMEQRLVLQLNARIDNLEIKLMNRLDTLIDTVHGKERSGHVDPTESVWERVDDAARPVAQGDGHNEQLSARAADTEQPVDLELD